MARCDYCGKEVTPPFSCQNCGGKFCDECRLPPSHTCENIGMWQKTPSLCSALVQQRRWSNCYRQRIPCRIRMRKTRETV